MPPDLLDGVTTDRFGRDLRLANLSPPRGKDAAKPTNGIYGRTYFASPVPDASGPSSAERTLHSWENRLRDRLAMLGSTEFALIWKATDLPSGRSKSRLVPSTRRTNGNVITGSHWRSPTAGEKRDGAYADPATPTARGHKGSR